MFSNWVVAIAAAFLALPAYAQGLTRADRPDSKQGDSWVFQGLNARTGEKLWQQAQVLEQVSDDRIVLRYEGGTRTYNRDWNLTEVKRGETVEAVFKPYWAYYQFPLEIGKSYDAKFESETRGGSRTARWQWKVKVIGSERVTVPAGSFDTLKLQYEGYYNVQEGTSSWTGTRMETVWYAPAAKRLVKSQLEERAGSYYNTEIVELVSFKLAQ